MLKHKIKMNWKATNHLNALRVNPHNIRTLLNLRQLLLLLPLNILHLLHLITLLPHLLLLLLLTPLINHPLQNIQIILHQLRHHLLILLARLPAPHRHHLRLEVPPPPQPTKLNHARPLQRHIHRLPQQPHSVVRDRQVRLQARESLRRQGQVVGVDVAGRGGAVGAAGAAWEALAVRTLQDVDDGLGVVLEVLQNGGDVRLVGAEVRGEGGEEGEEVRGGGEER